MDTPATSPVVFDELRCTDGARIGIATLNAEKSLNALRLEMIDLLAERLALWARDAGIVMVILQGAGERAFCAGADLHRMHREILVQRATPARDDPRAYDYALDFFEREYRLDYVIHTYPKPILGWGHGVVMGGGMGLMVGASHRVLTEQAKVAMPEINIGLYADVGGSWFLGRAPGRSGLFLALTAAQLNAGDAIFAGLGDYQIAHSHKSAIWARLTAQAWSTQPGVNHATLSALLKPFAQRPATPGPLRQHFDLIEALCDHDDPRELVAAICAVKTDDAWLSRAAATLSRGSPSTAALSIALQRRLRLASLAEVFRVELGVSLLCVQRPDLAEGIRALLIDKDRNPRWQPATLAEVTPEWVDGFFAPLWTASEHPLRDL